MLSVEGYKMFKGTIEITPPESTGIKAYTLSGTWLYKPDTGCWYGCGHSFPEKVCNVLAEE